MADKVVKLGVVGLGRGRGIVTDVIGDANIELTAICDMNPERVESARKFFTEEKGVKDLQCYSTLDELLNSDVEAVVLATDAPLHAQQAIKLLNAGKHVLSEIPTIFSIEDAKALKAAVKAHPELKYMAGENCNYWAFVQSWKRMREEGRFGDIVYAEGEYLHSGDPEKFSPEKNPKTYWRTTLAAIRYLTHELGPLLSIMDDRCVSVSCIEPTAKYNPYKIGPENGIALFRTAKGAAIRVFICFGAYVGGSIHNYALYGTRGSIETDRAQCNMHSFAKMMDIPGTLHAKFEIPTGLKFPEDQSSGHGGADSKMMRDFIRCIIEDTEPPIDVDAGINMSLPGIIAHESALQGGAMLEIPVIE